MTASLALGPVSLRARRWRHPAHCMQRLERLERLERLKSLKCARYLQYVQDRCGPTALVAAVAWLLLSGSCLQAAAEEFVVVDRGRPRAQLFVDQRGASGNGPAVLAEAASWLQESIQQASGAKLPIAETLSDREPVIIVGRLDQWPELAERAEAGSTAYDAFCVVAEPRRLYLLGNSEAAATHAVASLLWRWGFRWYAPSPRWHVIPQSQSLALTCGITKDQPALAERRIWYAYGTGGEDLAPLMQNYRRWAAGNRLSVASLMRTGHSYGNIIHRNEDTFAEHPEYYALLPDGQRDATRAVNARKFCYSNPELIALVANDRLKLLEQERKANPSAFMVSVDPSDGEGTCGCGRCAALGTPTDRVIHLANEVAKRLRAKYPGAWVGLYGYSSHRLPPTIEVEPNVYVQVAMGFNRTPYSLPQLIDLWSRKVGAIGQREYYGVEAWDWGLPGRMRGARVAYHQKWIPYYVKRKLNAINAETNANWGGQMLGLFVASQLMWDPAADVDSLVKAFFDELFGDAAPAMRKYFELADAAPPLRPATLLPLMNALQDAWKAASDPQIRARLSDMMAYSVYIAEFRKFELVRSRQSARDDPYYEALGQLMNYAWRIRHRDIVHYYALARRLCNGLPVQDKRLDYYMFNKERTPIWMGGEPYTDAEIHAKFLGVIQELQADKDPVVHYSRYLDRVRVDGQDRGSSRIFNDPRTAVARFRHQLRGYLVPAEKCTLRLGLAPESRSVTATVYLRGDTVLIEKTFTPQAMEDSPEPLQELVVELPKANEYRLEVQGNFALHVPPGVPLVFEASVSHPAWIDYSGPHYFYVPKGTKELLLDANPRLSLFAPGADKRIDVVPGDRAAGAQHVAVPVPAGCDGQLWATSSMTRGKTALLNIPPLMSFHAAPALLPREVAEADQLTTAP